ncbi:MAG: deoxyribodipyrimidine photo-lyase, partial [Candidatus Eisenbacteria bacterium]|nr:deoxyribodipyrimidine photo-lyase [Candidatus Eisenbacteria bacterium]
MTMLPPAAPLPKPTLVWFRQDLRLQDHPALAAAAARGGPVIPVYVWAPEEEGAWPPGAASRWWLHGSLGSLAASLSAIGSRLVVRTGRSAEVLRALAGETGADAVHWSRRYEPASRRRDADVEKSLSADGVQARSFNASLLHEPWTIRTRSGGPFQVFTPFWRACLAAEVPPAVPIPAPRRLRSPERWPTSVDLDSLGLLPVVDWAAGIREQWQPGEKGAAERLRRFLRVSLAAYPAQRDRPDREGVSRLSPHLHFGEIGPRQIVRAIEARAARDRTPGTIAAAEAYLRQLGWREFAYHLLHQFPRTAERPLREEFRAFPWRKDRRALRAWQRGETGYGIVDAGMRQLWSSGWMHNRARMIVASFLVKDLLIDWREGARWFWDTLVDADLA